MIEPGEELRKKIDFEQHDVIDRPPGGGPYDIIVMNHVLIHYPENTREKILKNVLATLKRGGFLVLEPAFNLGEREEGDVQTYMEWRQHFYEKYNLEPVFVKDPYLAEGGNQTRWNMGQFYQLTE